MLVVEKVFGIKIKDDSKKEDLCAKLASYCCFDKEKYKVDNSIICGKECQFFGKDGKCNSRIYEWLMSEEEEEDDA